MRTPQLALSCNFLRLREEFGPFSSTSTSKEMNTKKLLIWSLLGFFLFVSAARSHAQTTGETEKAVAALEEQWLQSQKTSNPDLLAPLLADKFVNTGSEGKVTAKTETLEIVKATKFTRAEYYDVKVTVFGNTAIATGGLKGKGIDASRKRFDENERWTDTWVQMSNGQWKCVASHASPVKM